LEEGSLTSLPNLGGEKGFSMPSLPPRTSVKDMVKERLNAFFNPPKHRATRFQPHQIEKVEKDDLST